MLSLAVAALVIKTLQPLQELPIDPGTEVPTYGYARDAQFEYLATPQGLYRSTRLATAAPQLIAFGDEAVHAVAVNDGALYVAKGAVNEAATHPEHTLVRSTDHGATFTNIDAALLDCSILPCAYLVPTRIGFGPDRIYVNAGGNILASADEGASWSQLYGLQSNGKPAAQVCPVKFELIGSRMLLGGECPLDVAWLHRGTLEDNLLEWADEPLPVGAPEMENRNIQFIRHVGDDVVDAGIEGALLESRDGGESFRYVLHYDLEARDRYPYLGQFVIVPQDPRVMLIGGFDKKNAVGYLAWSRDGGESWQDVSYLVGPAFVSLLTVDAEGRVLIGLQDGTRFVLAEVVLGEHAKRRAVR